MYEYTVQRYGRTRARHCSLRVHRTEVPALLPVLLLTSYMYMCVQVNLIILVPSGTRTRVPGTGVVAQAGPPRPSAFTIVLNILVVPALGYSSSGQCLLAHVPVSSAQYNCKPVDLPVRASNTG